MIPEPVVFGTLCKYLADYLKLRRDRKKGAADASLDDFRDWLRRQEHQQEVELLLDSQEMQREIGKLVKSRQRRTVRQISDLLEPIAAQLAGQNAQLGALDTYVRQDLPNVLGERVGALLERHVPPAVKDQEIDEARDLIRSGRFKDALIVLEQIRKHRWESLDNKGRYHVLANLAIVHQGMDDFETAADLFLKAKQHWPDREQARAFEALAWAMRSKHERAFELAKAVTQDFPRSVIGWATWINSAPASIPFGDVESTVPNEVQRDADVALALADRAALAGRHADAESYARKALEDCPKHPFVLASLGGYILRAIVETGQKSLGVRVSPKDVPRVREAIDCLTRAIDLLLPSASRESLSRILRNRAAGHRMLGETALGERDIVQAHEKSPAAPEIAIGYAYLLASRNQMGSAIASLPAACATNPMLEAKITLASLLDEQGTPQGREEAIRLLRSYDPHAEGIDPAWSPEYFALLFLLLSHVGRDSEANEALEHARRIGVPDPYLDTARAAAARERGNKAQAAQLLSGAFKDRAALTHVAHKAVLAKELQRAGLYREAFTAWHELVPPTAFGPYTLNLLHCGERAGEDSQLLDFCRTLRENGFYERPCIELEAHILFKYAEYDRAVEVFREGISHATEATDQRVLRLRLSALGVHLKRRELVEQDAELLPQSGEIAPGDSPAAVVVLRNGPDPAKAARFAYAVLRKHFDDEHAHAAMIMSLIGPFGPEVSLPDCPVAQTGCGVYYEEIDIPGQEPQFFILEDEESPNSERRELPAGHPTAKQLIGKRVNDEFLLFPGAVQERRARVKEIVPKLVVRFRDCLSGWQRRFPHRFFIQQVSMPKRADGQLDFAPMFRILDEQEKVAKTVEQLYRDKLVPVHVFAESLGRTVFESVLHVAGTEDLQLRCCAGTEAECSTALDILAQGPETVVDLTALATVFALEAFALLEHTDGLVVVQSTLDPEQA